MMTAVDLFAGAGGMSLGARWAGIQIAAAIDSDPHAMSTYAANHPGTRATLLDIRHYQPRRAKRRNRPNFVFGGPPCQGFSTSNQRTRNEENPVNWLYREHLRVARLLAPDWIVMENVKGLLETTRKSFYEEILRELAQMGYTPTTWLLNAQDFGVPQSRTRLFIVASRQNLCPAAPLPLFLKPHTVRDALSDLPSLENGAAETKKPYRPGRPSAYAKQMRGSLNNCENHLVTSNNAVIVRRFKTIPPLGNWKDIPDDLMTNYSDRTKCHTGIYRRLAWDKPSVVIGNFRKNMLIHPSEHRGLSVREAARLQSFPDSYSFLGSIGFQQQQVGNAVPPLMARAVFTTLLAAQ